MERARHKCIVKLQYGSYTGEETVYVDEDAESEEVKAKAWRQSNANFLSMAYRSATIVSRDPYSGE